VSTDFSPFIHDYVPHVRIASDATGFVASIRSFLEQPGDPAPRRDVARTHGWDAETQRLVALVEELDRGTTAAQR
jgi:hypothetical protein